MPAEIADLADGMWQRALKLASEAAQHEDNAARERLQQIEIENELRAQSFALREKEWDTAARAREQALADSHEHLLLLTRTLGRDQATLRARDVRIADLESQVEHYRQQVATLVATAVAKSHASTQRRGVRTESAPQRSVPTRRPRQSRSVVTISKVARRGAKSGFRHKSAGKSSSRRGR